MCVSVKVTNFILAVFLFFFLSNVHQTGRVIYLYFLCKLLLFFYYP